MIQWQKIRWFVAGIGAVALGFGAWAAMDKDAGSGNADCHLSAFFEKNLSCFEDFGGDGVTSYVDTRVCDNVDLFCWGEVGDTTPEYDNQCAFFNCSDALETPTLDNPPSDCIKIDNRDLTGNPVGGNDAIYGAAGMFMYAEADWGGFDTIRVGFRCSQVNR